MKLRTWRVYSSFWLIPTTKRLSPAAPIAKYASAGLEIGVVCATRGERGKTGDICSRDDLPRVREAELRDAAQILGIRHLEILPCRIRSSHRRRPTRFGALLVAALRRQRPRIVVTFDPNGMNLHPDRIAISRFASDAVAAAADPRWYPETGEPHTVERLLWCGPGRVFDLGGMENLASRAGMDFIIDIGPYRDKKNAALRAHRTQYPGLKKLFSRRHYDGPRSLPRRVGTPAVHSSRGGPVRRIERGHGRAGKAPVEI